MPDSLDPPDPPDPELNVPEGTSLLSAISREMVKAMKTYYGRGPTRAKSYLVDDLLFVVMRGGVTEAEKTMVEAGEVDAVRDFRQRFENVMAPRLVGAMEQLTERKVVNYQSQVLFDPDAVVEIFMFDRPIDRRAAEETARSLLAEEPDDGTVLPEDE
jgi:uncharacterized protein YbcI